MTRIVVDIDQWDSERLRSQAFACDAAGQLGAGMLIRRLAHHLDVQSACPLIVLDLDKGWLMSGVVRNLRSLSQGTGSLVGEIADQIEAQTKPPRIPEPMGRGAVVMAGDIRFPHTRYSSTEDGNDGNWINEDGLMRRWADLNNPTLISEGVIES